MPSNCAVATCKTWFCGKSRKKKCKDDFSLIRFPKDPAVRAEWVKRCARQDKFNAENAGICSAHFVDEDFDLSYFMKKKMMPDEFFLKRLKPGAVPSKNLPLSPAPVNSARSRRAAARRGESPPPAGAQPGWPTADSPLDPTRRAAIVQEAIADLTEREQRRQEEERLGKDVSAAPRRTPAPRRDASPSPDRYEPDDDSDDALSADGLDRQLKVMLKIQRKVHALERKLAARREELEEVAERSEKIRAEMGCRPAPVGGEPAPARVPPGPAGADPLLVLRPDGDQSLSDLPPGNSLLSVPSDIASATRVIFNLRMEVLALRSRVLQRAHCETSLRIQMIEESLRHACREKRLSDALDAVFTPAQQSRLLPAARPLAWDCEDYLRAIALRWVCRRRTFEHVRGAMKIPLPTMYALRSVAAFGRFPVVTRQYKELSEAKKALFDRPRTAARLRQLSSKNGRPTGPTKPGESAQPASGAALQDTEKPAGADAKRTEKHAGTEVKKRKKKEPVGSEVKRAKPAVGEELERTEPPLWRRGGRSAGRGGRGRGVGRPALGPAGPAGVWPRPCWSGPGMAGSDYDSDSEYDSECELDAGRGAAPDSGSGSEAEWRPPALGSAAVGRRRQRAVRTEPTQRAARAEPAGPGRG